MRLLSIQRNMDPAAREAALTGTLKNSGGSGTGQGDNTGGTGGAASPADNTPVAGQPGATQQGTEPNNQQNSGQNGNPNPTTTTVDEPGILKGIFGEGNTFASFQQVRESVGQLTTLQQSNSELAAKVEQFKPATPYVEALNEALRKGVSQENFHRAQAIDDLKNDPREAIILARQIKYPDLSREDIAFAVDAEYMLDQPFDPQKPDDTTKEVRLARIKMHTDATNAMQDLSQFKVKLLESPIEAKRQEITAAWKPVLPTLTGMKEVVVKTAEGDYKIPVSNEMQQVLANYANDVVANPDFNLMPGEEGNAQMQELLTAKFITDSLAKIIDDVRDAVYVQHSIQRHNPISITGTKEPATIKTGNAKDAMHQQMLKDRGIVTNY